MSLNYTTTVTVDLSGQPEPPLVPLKQGDIHSRALLITLLDHGQIYQIPSDVTVRAGMTKPDGTQVVNNVEIRDNAVYVLFTEQMLAAAGEGQLDVQFYQNTEVISSAVIDLRIYPAANVDRVVNSSPEYQAFREGLLRLETAFIDCDEAIKRANAATENCEVVTEDCKNRMDEAITLGEEAVEIANEAAKNAKDLTTVIDPISGQVSTVQDTFYHICALLIAEVASPITVGGFDSLNLTAGAFDEKNMTVNDFNLYAGNILGG